MTLSFQRLILILITIIMLLGAVLLILFNSKKNIIFFYTPSELIENNPPLKKIVRIGAFVEKGSVKKTSSDTYEFSITDNKTSIRITYKGILPDLFKEEQGIVIEGHLLEKKYIHADTVYAKHDENYMPASIKKELEKNKYWKKNYNQELPTFDIKNLYIKNEILNNKNLENEFVLINFFASWCAPCKIEHALLLEIQKNYPNLFLLGINHKDKIEDAKIYLNKEGNPYTFVGLDQSGMIALKFGVLGLPETFLINNDGKIIFKHMGPLNKKVINDEIRPFFQ